MRLMLYTQWSESSLARVMLMPTWFAVRFRCLFHVFLKLSFEQRSKVSRSAWARAQAHHDVAYVFENFQTSFNLTASAFQTHCIIASPKMRVFHRLLAVPSSVGAQSSGLKAVPPALLPPIPLYRRLLRAHRKHLPSEMRVLGDEYIKSEFRAHRDVENPVHIVG